MQAVDSTTDRYIFVDVFMVAINNFVFLAGCEKSVSERCERAACVMVVAVAW